MISKGAAMKNILLLSLCAFLGAFLGAAAPLRAEAPPMFDRAQRADGARVAPDRFLRAYDPVTVFFSSDTGPKAGGAEDTPQKYVTMTPQPAGEWRWLGPRALQFRPADAWKPLSRVDVKLGAAETKLVALLPTPRSTNPAEGADPQLELTQIALTFAEPVDVAALTRLLDDRSASLAWRFAARRTNAQRFAPMRSARWSGASAPRSRPTSSASVNGSPTAASPSCGCGFPTKPDSTTRPMNCGCAPRRPSRRRRRAAAAAGATTAPKTCCVAHPILRRPRAATRKATPPPSPMRRRASGSSRSPSMRRPRRSTFCARARRCASRRPSTILPSRPTAGGCASSRNSCRTGFTNSPSPQGALKDSQGRALASAFSQRFAFTRDAPALQWDAGYGVAERFGPQLLPLRGRGYDRADIRIHAIDPLSRDFFPFPAHGVDTSDSDAPPLPGNEPKSWSETANIEADAIKQRIKSLGSPAVSRLVDLPIRRNGPDAKFGVDLKEDFAKVSGRDQPGTYLVGLRAVDDDKRRWLRVQITDLSLSAIEEPTRVRFAVTSLSTTQPVSGAQIRVEGIKDEKFVTLASGTTDASGFFSWTPDKRGGGEARRIVANKGLDTLVIDPNSAPSEYSREIWSKPESEWLAWTSEADQPRAEKPRTLCHLFSERPIYRPEEFAHIKGFVRSYRGGALSLDQDGRNACRDRARQSGMAHSGEARRERRLLSQVRRANSGDRRLFGAVRTGCAEKVEEGRSAEERSGGSRRGRERSGRARSGHFLRPVHLQEGSLSTADL